MASISTFLVSKINNNNTEGHSPIGLRRELEVGVDLDPGDAVGAPGQRLGRRLEDVLAERHSDLRGSRPRHAVPRRHHVPLVH